MTELNGTVKEECEDPEEVISPGVEFLSMIKKPSDNVTSNVSIPLHCVAKSKINSKGKNIKFIQID